ncbi:YbhN family protein [Amycolatopsis sp. NPDC051903]|uniref:YbhN family protein n=1 Tax=Amycolatopsis sp. NPDC051903 TaxID=3363936 RepID=UPI003795A159
MLLAITGIGVAVWRLAPTLASVDDLPARFAALRWPWLIFAIVLAVASLVAYGELHRRLLGCVGVGVRGSTVQAVNFVGNAMAQTLPSAGATVGVAYMVAALRGRGVDTAVSLWSTAMAAVLSATVLVVLAPALLFGVGLLAWPAALAVSVLLAAISMVVWKQLRRPAALHWIAHRLVVLGRHLPVIRNQRWVRVEPSPLDEVLGRVARLRPPIRTWPCLIGWALASWVLDYLALAASVTASAGTVPWSAVAVGYLAVQASIGVQLTPAGAGPAETGLLAALAAGGITASAAAIAIVVFRSITWLGLTAVGWIVFAITATGRNMRRRNRPA